MWILTCWHTRSAGVVRKGEDIGLLLWVGKGIALRQGKAQDGLTLLL